MVRFIAGIITVLVVQAIGLSTVMAGLRKADAAAKAAWASAQATVEKEASK
ncbi:MAG TPA: hypothetical protein VI197_30145 [Polyangiaceae bacterium]